MNNKKLNVYPLLIANRHFIVFIHGVVFVSYFSLSNDSISTKIQFHCNSAHRFLNMRYLSRFFIHSFRCLFYTKLWGSGGEFLYLFDWLKSLWKLLWRFLKLEFDCWSFLLLWLFQTFWYVIVLGKWVVFSFLRAEVVN